MFPLHHGSGSGIFMAAGMFGVLKADNNRVFVQTSFLLFSKFKGELCKSSRFSTILLIRLRAMCSYLFTMKLGNRSSQ